MAEVVVDLGPVVVRQGAQDVQQGVVEHLAEDRGADALELAGALLLAQVGVVPHAHLPALAIEGRAGEAGVKLGQRRHQPAQGIPQITVVGREVQEPQLDTRQLLLQLAPGVGPHRLVGVDRLEDLLGPFGAQGVRDEQADLPGDPPGGERVARSGQLVQEVGEVLRRQLAGRPLARHGQRLR
jgi:hypothetical protein